MAKKDNASSAPAKKKKQEEAKPFTEAPRLKVKYTDEVVPALREKFGYKNPMEIPKLDKIVLNMGLGSEKDNAKGLENAVNELSLIAGQKPSASAPAIIEMLLGIGAIMTVIICSAKYTPPAHMPVPAMTSRSASTELIFSKKPFFHSA